MNKKYNFIFNSVKYYYKYLTILFFFKVLLGKCVYLYGGVKIVFISWFNPFKPLNNRLDVTADFTLERSGSSIVHSGVDGVITSQNGFRVGTL